MVALCGARLIWEVTSRRRLLPFITTECNKLEGIALPQKATVQCSAQGAQSECLACSVNITPWPIPWEQSMAKFHPKGMKARIDLWLTLADPLSGRMALSFASSSDYTF